MPVKGFAVLTVKKEYLDCVRHYYRTLVDGDPVILPLPRSTYALVQRFLRSTNAEILGLESSEDLAAIAILEFLERVPRRINVLKQVLSIRSQNSGSKKDLDDASLFGPDGNLFDS